MGLNTEPIDVLLRLSNEDIDEIFKDFEYELEMKPDSITKSDLKRLRKILYKISNILAENEYRF